MKQQIHLGNWSIVLLLVWFLTGCTSAETSAQLGATVHAQGPLDEGTRSLVKLALAIGVGAEGAVHAHTRKCLAAGHSAEAVRQVVLLAIPTVGFPAAMAALSWVNDILEHKDAP